MALFNVPYLTSHSLIHLTDAIRKQLDSKNCAWKIFFDLQTAFWYSIPWHSYPLKLNHDGVRGVANNWFSSDLEIRSQYVSINDFTSNLEYIRCGIPQGSILAALLLSIYINDLNCAIRYCSIPHFVDDTNLLNYKSSVELMNKEVNQRLGKFNKLAECN